HHHGSLTFSLAYAFNENFVLPLSHDEVVHGKGSLLGKMPGDEWRQFANLRLLFGYMWTHPGKKLLFMGCEFGQRREWTHEGQLEWWVADMPPHAGVQRLVGDLNRLYRAEPALHQFDFSSEGFEWIDSHDAANSVIAFLRHPSGPGPTLLVVCNFTPMQRDRHAIGVPEPGYWRELLNTDATDYGGSGVGNQGGLVTEAHRAQGRTDSLRLTLPALSMLVFKHEPNHG
ncbi:MAG: alpha amylase C-terminal domain-containing protein, partial [Caldimonas sp.]